ncbi:MAG: hypothetical protein RBR54_08010 [Sulfurimonas sp.]|jgi:hypothetical protein|nr:hypothetical protein [Sulfurimonas sp.]
MQAAYSLNSNELNINFVNAIKEMFQNKDIEIIITDHSAGEVDDYRKFLSQKIEQYKTNPESFVELGNDFWQESEKRLIQRHQQKAM